MTVDNLADYYEQNIIHATYCNVCRVVVLDPVLCDALYVKGQPPLEQLKWAELMNRLCII